jgi:serine/threonine protein kinase
MGTEAWDGTQWIPGLFHNPSNNLSASPHDGNTIGENQLLWQQNPPLSSGQPFFNIPQTLRTQTAPPFQAVQPHVYNHRQYHTDSQVNGLQTNSTSGLGSFPAEVRPDQHIINPEFPMGNGRDLSSGLQPHGDTPGFQDFLPVAVEIPKTFYLQPTIKPQQSNNFALVPKVSIIDGTRPRGLPPRRPERRPRHRLRPNHSQQPRVSPDPASNIHPESVISKNAVSVFENWLKNYPSILIPEDEHFRALATLTGLKPEAVKSWFGQKLRQETVPELSTTASSRTMSNLSTLGDNLDPTGGLCPQTWSKDSALREAARWVRQNKGHRCTAVQDLTQLLRDNMRPYQCTHKCGKTFGRRDDWRKHEEINCPQEAWLCDVDSTAVRAGVRICAFCGVENPEINHMQQKHSQKIACHNKPFGEPGRISYRKDKLRQHFKNAHPMLAYNGDNDSGHFIVGSKFRRNCGFCNYVFSDWKNRINHIGDHFESHTEARDMRQWHDPDEVLDEGDHNEDDDDSDDDSNDQNRQGDEHARDWGNGDDDHDDSMSDSSFDDAGDCHQGSAEKQGYQYGLGTMLCAGSDVDSPVVPFHKEPLNNRQLAIEHWRAQPSIFNWHTLTAHGRQQGLAISPYTQFVSQFISLRVLGFGPYSTVDEVQHRQTGLICARKTIHYSGKRGLESLVAEVEIMKKLNHPHIVQFVDSYEYQHSISILMTPSADFDLGHFLETHPGVSDPCMDIMQQWFNCLVSTVHYMHSNFIKHQDIKPSNILIQGRSIYLADFGVAKEFVDLESTTSTSGNMTRQYCSPETARKGCRGRRSDIFSLGCVFVEMLSFLFDGELGVFKSFQNTHFIGDGTFQENLVAMEDWMRYLYANPALTSRPYLQNVLDACKMMLQEDSSVRPSARDLMNILTPGECCFFPGESPRSRDEKSYRAPPQIEGSNSLGSESTLLDTFQGKFSESSGRKSDEGYSLYQYRTDLNRREALWLELAGHAWVQSLFFENRYSQWFRTRFNWTFDGVRHEKALEMPMWNLSGESKCEEHEQSGNITAEGLGSRPRISIWPEACAVLFGAWPSPKGVKGFIASGASVDVQNCRPPTDLSHNRPISTSARIPPTIEESKDETATQGGIARYTQLSREATFSSTHSHDNVIRSSANSTQESNSSYDAAFRGTFEGYERRSVNKTAKIPPVIKEVVNTISEVFSHTGEKSAPSSTTTSSPKISKHTTDSDPDPAPNISIPQANNPETTGENRGFGRLVSRVKSGVRTDAWTGPYPASASMLSPLAAYSASPPIYAPLEYGYATVQTPHSGRT